MKLPILFATSEIAPWVRTGGLGEVSSALPRALASLGMDVRVLVPGYPALLDAFPDRKVIAAIQDDRDALAPAALSLASLGRRLALLMIECRPYFERAGSPYLDERGTDWADNALRFGLLSKVAALLASTESPLQWRPRILHCNDWQTALAPAYLRYTMRGIAPSLTTIHNLAFQGLFARELLGPLGLPQHAFTFDGVEFFGQLSFLKAGLQCCDHISTVSPTYLKEICTPEQGCGLDGLLRHRADRVTGILNGIDTSEWNPRRDPLLPAHYNRQRLAGKTQNRELLKQRLALDASSDGPLLAIVSRFTAQKGIDLVLDSVEPLVNRGASFAVLGSGDRVFEEAWGELARRYPHRVAVQIGFDNALAHLIEAGADLFLMPSRFEPCGLNQMYSLAYGTPPVVRATGGLADIVVDCNAETLADGSANGFCFITPSTDALIETVLRAVEVWRQPRSWRRLQRNGMALDFSWSHAARRYAELYAALGADLTGNTPEQATR